MGVTVWYFYSYPLLRYIEKCVSKLKAPSVVSEVIFPPPPPPAQTNNKNI